MEVERINQIQNLIEDLTHRLVEVILPVTVW